MITDEEISKEKDEEMLISVGIEKGKKREGV